MSINYYRFSSLLGNHTPSEWLKIFEKEAVPEWIAAYQQAAKGKTSIVFVTVDGLDYVFDIELGRGIGSYGISGGKHTGARDSSRMRGHPQSAASEYHRGHIIAHTLGGGTDINLFSQKGRLNIGAFRRLENQAVARPGALYFVRLIYDQSNDGQLPDHIEQGLMADARQPKLQLKRFEN